MFTIYFTNHFYFSSHRFSSIEDALKWGQKTGMEFTVHHRGVVVAGYAMFRGVVYYGEGK